MSTIVRSRYTAYATGNVDYIISSTHPENPCYESDEKLWRKNLGPKPYGEYIFEGVEIIEDDEHGASNSILFRANLRHKETSEREDFKERSFFARLDPDGPFLYKNGVVDKL